MSNPISKIHIENFKSLSNISVELNDLNILFGPNGVGKSTFLDTIWFIRDCATRGVDLAATDRDHGIGLLWENAEPNSHILISVETETFTYQLELGFSSGRIEPFVGEKLLSKLRQITLIERLVGSDKANFYHNNFKQTQVTLRQPEKLALNQYLFFEDNVSEAIDADRLFRFAHLYDVRGISLYPIQKFGSESGTETWLKEHGKNLWSVLRNLKDRRALDARYDTIMEYMRRAFPNFDDVLLEQTGVNTVYGNFIEKNRRQPIKAIGISDGHLQLLINLTCLFSEGENRDSILLYDEPETSLHPYAIAIFAQAVEDAVKAWNKQVIIATHSPVLLSQFSAEKIFAGDTDEKGSTILRRLSEIQEIQDLLEKYAAGSLYMAEAIAPQSHPSGLK